jgi:hypothetical protein
MLRYFVSILGLLSVACPHSRAAPLELSFPPGITWKQVFDSGFRPKHIPGLERKKVECPGQELVFRFRDKPGFQLESGRLMFELQSDNSIRIIEHVGRVPISMEEGEKRMEIFHGLFSKELIRKGSVPPLMDKERGGVAALSDYYAAAENEGYTIHYGFTGSFQPGKPLLPIFMVALRHNMEAVPLPIRRETVKPPEGFEWYSLDPKVSTPDPGSATEALPKSEIRVPEKETPAQPKVVDESEQPVMSKVVNDDSQWALWLISILGLIIAAVMVWRWKLKSTR